MLRMITLTRRTTRAAALGLLGAALLPVASARAQTIGANGFGARVHVNGVVQQSSVVELPSTGGYAVGDDLAFGVANLVASESLTSVTTGGGDATRSSSQTSSSVEAVNVLNGLIRADVVTAIASSFRNADGAGSDAEGSGFAKLVVNGVVFTDDPAPNTRIDLDGAGYVVLNEQLQSGDGVTTSAITVNMIRVVLRDPLTGAETGEIIVGSASSRVGS